MSKQLLILDVDETLVYADEKLLSRAPDFRIGPFNVYRRPFLSEFVAAVADWFDIAVWSSASGPYVHGVVENVFGTAHNLRFVWSCERCTRRYHPELQEYYYAKNLSKLRRLGYALEKVLMVDDSPEKLSGHYGNHVRVRPFTGDEADRELHDLLPFLDSLRAAENVRRIEKRFWRASLGGTGLRCDDSLQAERPLHPLRPGSVPGPHRPSTLSAASSSRGRSLARPIFPARP